MIFMILDLHLIGSIRVTHYINKYLPQLQGDSPQTDEPKREENAPGFPANEQKKKKSTLASKIKVSKQMEDALAIAGIKLSAGEYIII